MVSDSTALGSAFSASRSCRSTGLPVPLIRELATRLLNEQADDIEPQLGLALHHRQKDRNRLVQLTGPCQRLA